MKVSVLFFAPVHEITPWKIKYKSYPGVPGHGDIPVAPEALWEQQPEELGAHPSSWDKGQWLNWDFIGVSSRGHGVFWDIMG